METSVWIGAGIAFATLLLGLHQYVRGQQKVLDKKIDDRVEKCVSEAIRPLAEDVTEIKSKLKNGLIHASEQHTDSIADLKVDVGKLAVTTNHIATDVENLSRQLEVVLNTGRT